MGAASAVPLRELQVRAYRIPTEGPESDGTLQWDSTTLVLVRAGAGGREGLGYTYADSATAVGARADAGCGARQGSAQRDRPRRRTLRRRQRWLHAQTGGLRRALRRLPRDLEE